MTCSSHISSIKGGKGESGNPPPPSMKKETLEETVVYTYWRTTSCPCTIKNHEEELSVKEEVGIPGACQMISGSFGMHQLSIIILSLQAHRNAYYFVFGVEYEILLNVTLQKQTFSVRFATS